MKENYCNLEKNLGIDISKFQNSINHLLYTVMTKDNNYLEFYYNEDFEDLYIHDVKHNKGVDFPNSDDAITVINVVDINNIKTIIIEEYFIEECKEELIRRFHNHELTDIEMLLYKNC